MNPKICQAAKEEGEERLVLLKQAAANVAVERVASVALPLHKSVKKTHVNV